MESQRAEGKRKSALVQYVCVYLCIFVFRLILAPVCLLKKAIQSQNDICDSSGILYVGGRSECQ